MARKTAAKTARTGTRATPTTRATAPAERAASDRAVTGRRTAVVAHLVTGEDLKSALISSDDEPDVEFEGDDPRDQRASLTTDAEGVLTWALVIETAFPGASWRLTLTRRGDAEGPPDAAGTTDGRGRAASAAIRNF